MKYVYYERTTGEIKIISPAKETESTDPYIEVEDNEVDHLHSGKESSARYFVKPMSRTYPVGKLVKKDSASLNWTSINDWLYLIPKEEPPSVEFKIIQDIPNKTIVIQLSKEAKTYWANNGFFKRTHFPITATSGPDPHNFEWVKIFETSELMNIIQFKYKGSDDIRFYSHRFFDCYYHEQIA
jgi:hypothetical protein